ncbi:Metallo-dependent phosphatase [Meredithblackwellia eburnea MCA 4105]
MSMSYLTPATDSPGLLRSRASSPLPTLSHSNKSAKATSASLNGITSYKRDKERDRNRQSAARQPRILERFSKKVLITLLISLITVVGIWRHYQLSSLVVLVRFKLRDTSFREGWINGCGLRKKPLLFLKGGNEVNIVWETNCKQQFQVWVGPEQERRPEGRFERSTIQVGKWDEAPVKASRIREKGSQIEGSEHWVYLTTLDNLERGKRYSYKLVPITTSAFTLNPDDSSPLSPDHQEEEHHQREIQNPKPIAQHSFTFLPSAAALSSWDTPPGKKDRIHISTISDNQFNLRTFHSVLVRLISFSRSTQKATPSLILHAGDMVQNPHNLPQWQTDFWDPFTSLLGFPLGQSTLLAVARGNHDWDESGLNVFVGGSPRRKDWTEHLRREKGRSANPAHRGTYYSISPHPRMRLLVLDSNLPEEDQVEQEEWLQWELGRTEWTGAGLRVVMVHVPPFLEWWDRRAWTEGGESNWSTFVRHRLTPLLSLSDCHLVLSGHSHAYSRGFLPSALIPSFTSPLITNSSQLASMAIASARERGWEKSIHGEREEGTVFVISGGAGGTLDEDKVEEWGFYEKSVSGVYHFGDLVAEFGVDTSSTSGTGGGVVRDGRAKNARTYKFGTTGCREDKKNGRAVMDTLDWKAVDLKGKVFDQFRIEVTSCRSIYEF